MSPRLLLFLGIAITLVCLACQPPKTKKIVKPFAEAETIECTSGTERVENYDSSFPEVFCIGELGKSGPWLEFDENGSLKTKANYVDDKMQGLWTSYHPNGVIDAQGMMKQNMRVGEWKQWYVDRTLRSEKEYKNNLYNGKTRLYYRNGALMAEGQFENDLEEGQWKVYTPENKLARECLYAAGQEKNCVIHIKEFEVAYQ